MDAGLLEDLADRGVLGRLARLDVALGQGPDQPAPPVTAGDQGRLRLAAPAVEHESARGRLLDAGHRGTLRRRLRGAGHMGRINRVNAPPVAPRLRSADVPPDSPTSVSDAQRRAVAELAPLAGVLTGIGRLFAAAGHELALVGGPVRDALLGRLSASPDADLDFTTDARPEEVLALLDGFAETTWDVGIRFGTVGARVAGREVEITTYRAEQYDPESRKPQVDFGDTLEETSSDGTSRSTPWPSGCPTSPSSTCSAARPT